MAEQAVSCKCNPTTRGIGRGTYNLDCDGHFSESEPGDEHTVIEPKLELLQPDNLEGIVKHTRLS